jgi:hypothetical protein
MYKYKKGGCRSSRLFGSSIASYFFEEAFLVLSNITGGPIRMEA